MIDKKTGVTGHKTVLARGVDRFCYTLKVSASTKSHASGKIKIRYFRNLRIRSGVFFDADSDAPHMT